MIFIVCKDELINTALVRYNLCSSDVLQKNANSESEFWNVYYWLNMRPFEVRASLCGASTVYKYNSEIFLQNDAVDAASHAFLIDFKLNSSARIHREEYGNESPSFRDLAIFRGYNSDRLNTEHVRE